MMGNAIARIVGTGSYLPKRILTNKDLEGMVETSDEWIVSRTGIKERRLAEDHEYPSDMGAQAAIKALQASHVSPEEIDMIIVATMSPDYIAPSTANLIQAKLFALQAATMDIQAACTGFLSALSIAKAYIESGIYQTVLVIAAEKMSAFMDYTDRSTCVLFGDGACAAVVKNKGSGLKIEAICLGGDGTLADLGKIPAGGSRHPASLETVHQKQHYFQMNGNEIFKHAVRRMSSAARHCLMQAGLDETQIKWLVAHQANQRIIDAIAKNFNLPQEKVYKTIHKYGNTSASSVGIALDELIQEKACQEGDYLLLAAFGIGLTWGASLLSQISPDSHGLGRGVS